MVVFDHFRSYIIFFLAFVISLIFTYIIRKWTLKKSILDRPNERSLHTIPTPRGGGVTIAILWFTGILILFLHSDISLSQFLALLCGLPIAVIGLVDDLFTITPKLRIFVQFVCATIAIICLGGLNYISIGETHISIPLVLSAIALFGIVWFTNLFNFLDGIDGYISAEVIFVCLTSYILSGDGLMLFLAAVTLGFLVWNWQPAKIFMGDVGSTMLGFTIAVIAIYHQNSGLITIPIWLILTSVFWFDASLTLFRRWRNRETLSKAHRKHAYQRIVQAGFSHQKTVILAFIINLIGFGLACMATIYDSYNWLFLCADLIFLSMVVRYIDKKNPFQYN